MRSIAAHAYALSPGAVAVPLAYISGDVYAGPTASYAAVIDGATVEIVTGESAGKRAVTIANGSFMIEFLRLGQPFTIRASKPGYTSDSHDHPGVVDSEGGFPTNTGIQFHIQPLS
jgi:hypothetical protein